MELKDVLNYLGAEDAKDLDSFKKAFSGKYLVKAEAHEDEDVRGKITGKITGAIQTLAKRTFGFSSEEIAGKKWEEIIEAGAARDKAAIEELKSKQGQTNDQTLKELQEKFDKVSAKANEYKGLVETTKKAYEDLEKSSSEKYKSLKVGNVLSSAKGKIQAKLKSEMSKAESHYLDSLINENIKVDFDEQDEVIVLGKDGKRMANTAKAGTFFTLEEAIESIADKEGFIKKNNGGGVNPAAFVHNNNNNQQQNNQQQTERKVHPNALKNAELLKVSAQR
jgi:hypothetical protein